ncbi:hypothetical protein TWF281_007524 [Arthrobotrys megalospora]
MAAILVDGQPADKLFDSVSRINRDIASIFPIPTNLLVNVRNVQIHSQLVNVCGRCFQGHGVRHTWAYDLIPHLLLLCPVIDNLEVEIESAWYSYDTKLKVNQQHVSIPLPVERSVNPFLLRSYGVIDASGARWASTSREWAEHFWPKYLEEWNEKKPQRNLFRLSISLTGQSYFPVTFSIKNVWYILTALGILDTIGEVEVKNLHTYISRYPTPAWFTAAIPGGTATLPELQAKKVKTLRLECGEEQVGGFDLTLRQLKHVFPNLENLSIATVGVFLREDLAFLDNLTTLRQLSITERSNQELEQEEGPDSIYATNLLIECMELLLHPPNLRTIRWNRAGYQRVHCEILKGHLEQIEFVDVWLTIGEEKILVGERYDGWYFREELFHATGCEDRWGKLWMKRFLTDTEMMEPFGVEPDPNINEETRSEASAEAIPW